MDSPAMLSGGSATVGRSPDCRRAVRYTAEAEVEFTWSDIRGVQSGLGWTRDISPKGVYVVAPSCPPRGARVTMDIHFAFPAEPSRAFSLQGEGRTQRVDSARKGRSGGFSVAYERMTICTGGK